MLILFSDGGEESFFNVTCHSANKDERQGPVDVRQQTAGQTLRRQALCPTALPTQAENKISFHCLTCCCCLSSFISLFLFSVTSYFACLQLVCCINQSSHFIPVFSNSSITVCLWPSRYFKMMRNDERMTSRSSTAGYFLPKYKQALTFVILLAFITTAPISLSLMSKTSD